MMSSGEVTLPFDLDIFLPSLSLTNPCVSTVLKGARLRVATALKSEVWNQPRC